MSKQPGTGTQEPLKRKEHSLTARHKCAPQGTAIDPEKTVSDDHRRDTAKRGWQPEGFGPEGTSTGSRAQRFEDANMVMQFLTVLKSNGWRLTEIAKSLLLNAKHKRAT